MQATEKLNEIDQHIAALEEKIKIIAKKEGYITYEVKTKRLPSDSGGYMGILYAIDIKGKTEQGDDKTNIFVKRIVYCKTQLLFEVPKIYKRELFVYTDLMKQMFDLQDEADVPITDRYKVAKVFEGSDPETIILENLTVQGFKTWYRMDTISLEFAELAVKQLARFHGLAIALEIKRPEYFDKNMKGLDCVYICNEYLQAFTHSMCMFVSIFLPENLRDRVLPGLFEVVNKFSSCMNDACGFKTLCHGDFRHSNILVKEIDGKLDELLTIDYQMIFYGNPVLDLIYFIFWGTDQQFRRLHMETLKHLYYHHLDNFLHYFSINLKDIFPRNEFERQCQEKLEYGLMISVFMFPFQFPKDVDASKIDEAAENFKKFDFELDDRFTERFRGIVDDFIKWGYL